MPNSIDCRYRAAAAAPMTPSVTPNSREHDAFAKNQAEHLRPLRAERHANADLLRAGHHG